MKQLFIIIALFLVACGSDSKAPAKETSTAETAAGASLTQKQLLNGIGPIDSFTFEEFSADKATIGKETFELKCSACHKIEARHVGPALKDVTTRRTPEFILNMILNPEEMVKRHPEVQKLLGEYFIPMTFQNVSKKEAINILEYFRQIDSQ